MLINPQEFVIDIPDLHPLSQEYVYFWREQRKRCFEGYWLGGYYMPPGLYFYVNMGTIQASPRNSNLKKLMRPSLRDLEWEFFYNWTEARGFSGFELDDDFSSNKDLLDPLIPDEWLPPSALRPDGTRKLYIPPSENLRKHHPHSKGRALYENSAQNLLMLGSRDTGKSYMVGVGVVLHQFLVDGATHYTEEIIKNPQKIELTVGAETSDKSSLLLNKTKIALDLLPGSKIIGNTLYPSPLSKQYRGSWTVGKQIEATYSRRYKGGWETAGSRSTIKHRTFNDNPFADQGSRPLAIVLEEVGLFSNLKEVYANTKDNLRDGLRQIGSLLMMGTGGDMEMGTLAAFEMFYSPEAYNILSFPDIWENRGQIAFFVPAYLALNQFKDERGFSKVDQAKDALLKERQKVRSGKGGSFALNKEMQYRPIVPSEMFLTRNSNIFPVPELRRRLSEILDKQDLLQNKVNLLFDPSSPYNGVSYEIDHRLTPIDVHPWPEDAEKEGAIVIYEFPYLEDGKTPEGAYIIGCDPFKDDNPQAGSFASIYVLKTNRYPTTVGYDQIVATYVGRPYMGKNEVNEILHKLSLFYGNAKIYFENAVGNVKDYFEKVHRLDLLALQPTHIFNRKASYNTNTPLVYGYPMSNQKIKMEALQYLRSWLLTEREPGVRNLDLIPDTFLLNQLITFNMEGNFDAVMGMVGAVIGLEELYSINKRKIINQSAQTELQIDLKRLITNNRRLFNENISKTTPFLSRKVG